MAQSRNEMVVTTSKAVLARCDRTNSMLGSTQQVHSAGSNVSTPGAEFPGSYPKDRDEHVTSSTTSGSNKFTNPDGSPVGAEYVQSAKQYIPDQVEHGIETAGQTAAAYLPIPQGVRDTVSAYWKPGQAGGAEAQGNGTSLPSTEHEGANHSEHLSSGGGALPGSVDERGVAVVPDDRAGTDGRGSATQGKRTSLPSTELEGAQPSDHLSAGVGALPGSIKEHNVAVLPEERRIKDGPKVPIGIGSLPGSRDESSVALLPDERAAGQAREPTTEASKATEPLAPAKPQPAERSAAGVAAADTGTAPKTLPDIPDSASPHPTSAKPQTTTAKAMSAPNQDTDYHPANLHPPPTGPGVDEPVNPAGSTGADENGPSSSSVGAEDRKSEESTRSGSKTSSGESQHRRSGFMTKVKNEMKIISGKISGNDGKVEEGKKAKAGEV
ncbi:hypothetical protein CONPUDRAFT_93740 [Coniophora puteana RWD-64-598 SS2]|uniref:Uncharacterized protein n=1 Tax=Coniophora puteana (strain RWD-64-598) TaxID=741705 RepID=A0A5M3M8B3_CONPW|nr:uncharacterized protein CONPUDRAFT_93740 [Coniophora puteana RWD-64-598 SS2]EIW75040.1 hypothetical protein CONPUDRAFT_93740 [Coniophora puteana RWD-64-598 SS2]